ncbi:ArgJ family protein, partial [Helicosporidium sp. ATCC 50920]
QGMYAELRLSGEGKADLGLVLSDRPANGAGTFTTNVMCAAPVSWCKRVLSLGRPVRALLVNSGQANAATGSLGDENARASASGAAVALGLDPDAVLLQSTGVIGKQVRMEQLLAALPTLAKGLERSEEAGRRLAVAMTTTDLAYKSAALEVRLPESGRTVRLGGAAKGSGMIHPNMATMLGVVTCDAAVDPAVWQVLVSRATDASYNQITVDGDTSTNDCVLALCNGAAVGDGHEIKSLESADARALGDALTALCQGLAKSIAWDGEGATMLLECQVSGAGNDSDARRVAKSVVGSSLVKAAMFGCYPNWGRLAAAAGYAGVSYLQESVAIRLGDIALMRDGQPLEFDFEAARAYLRGVADAHGTAHVHISIGTGPGKGKAWGCDLSYDYVKINVGA